MSGEGGHGRKGCAVEVGGRQGEAEQAQLSSHTLPPAPQRRAFHNSPLLQQQSTSAPLTHSPARWPRSLA
jgi:hypothetical protein